MEQEFGKRSGYWSFISFIFLFTVNADVATEVVWKYRTPCCTTLTIARAETQTHLRIGLNQNVNIYLATTWMNCILGRICAPKWESFDNYV